MKADLNWKVSALFNGTAWHITLNGRKIGPAIRGDSIVKSRIAWLHEAGQDIIDEISEQLGGNEE